MQQTICDRCLEPIPQGASCTRVLIDNVELMVIGPFEPTNKTFDLCKKCGLTIKQLLESHITNHQRTKETHVSE